MTGPQPNRDYIPRDPWAVRIRRWVFAALLAAGFCGIVWIASVGLADAVWSMWEAIG